MKNILTVLAMSAALVAAGPVKVQGCPNGWKFCGVYKFIVLCYIINSLRRWLIPRRNATGPHAKLQVSASEL